MITATDGAGAPPERVSELRGAVGRFQDGRTRLVARYHESPLKIAKAFPIGEKTDGLAVIQMDVSPGMLEGDHYKISWNVGEGARLYVTNQATTRVHPCPRGGTARLTQRINVADGAVLQWLPEPVMLFKDAAFSTDTEIELAGDAACVWSEICCPGRVARGEAFAFRAYDAKLTVRLDGRLIHYQRQRWDTARLPISAAGCFGSFTHTGSLYVFGQRVTPSIILRIRERLEQEVASEHTWKEAVLWGAANTARHGFVLQAAGYNAWMIQALFQSAWDTIGSELWNAAPVRLLKQSWMTSGS